MMSFDSDPFRVMILGGNFPSLTILKMSIVKRTSGWKQGKQTFRSQMIIVIIMSTITIIFSSRTIINTQASLDNGANFLNESQVKMMIITSVTTINIDNIIITIIIMNIIMIMLIFSFQACHGVCTTAVLFPSVMLLFLTQGSDQGDHIDHDYSDDPDDHNYHHDSGHYDDRWSWSSGLSSLP